MTISRLRVPGSACVAHPCFSGFDCIFCVLTIFEGFRSFFHRMQLGVMLFFTNPFQGKLKTKFVHASFPVHAFFKTAFQPTNPSFWSKK